jgi:membrane associated rhomboid family serine protease
MLTDVLSAYGYVAGVVTLSLFDWNLPTEDDFNAFNFKDLSCRSVVHIGPISLNVTMPATQFLQAAGSTLSPGTRGNVAWWAHIGGFIMGWVLLRTLAPSTNPLQEQQAAAESLLWP